MSDRRSRRVASLIAPLAKISGCVLALLLGVASGDKAAAAKIEAGQSAAIKIAAGDSGVFETPSFGAGSIIELQADLPVWDLQEGEGIAVTFSAEGQRDVAKTLNAGDPGMCVPIRIVLAGGAKISVRSQSPRELPLNLRLSVLPVEGDDRLAFEAEPNNSWREANPMALGRAVYGNNDDTDYLDNKDEKPVKNYANGLDNPVRDHAGLDWFKIEYGDETPKLIIFELDVLDRDVSVNLRMYRPNADGSDVELYLEGKDPMEIIHDREPERYSKTITRILSKGTYYLQVNGNHPRYILRSKIYKIPPYDNAADAVAVGAHYIMNVGDAWVAQVPREGNIYRRVQNMHDTSLRCTACHPSIFSTETVLTAKKAGYPIEAKSNFRYVVDRIYNGPTPLYGPLGLNWQRYIAIPMQSQGKHGGILIDFEKYVSGRETKTFERYAPFLRHAWTGTLDELDKLHEDEQNGVVPADSNVGFAARDWKVLMEAYRRTGDKSYLASAENIRAWLTGDLCDQKNIQDKIHRLWAFSLLGTDAAGNSLEPRKAAAIEEIMALRNTDGGWPDITDPGRPSAVYTTGQAVWTLTQAGVTLANRPELQKSIDYILSQQQKFGGWFQTTTHENFQTPMRETRYAVMALAATHPVVEAGTPYGWGNRDRGAGRIPRTDTLLHTLDDLDNLWEVPKGRGEEFTAAIVKLLSSGEPLVRATAAETLGRIGTNGGIEPLAKLLADPVKDVMRASAWALRQFGNRGAGIETIKGAIASGDPATRRGAARVFAYHYFGMDERLDIAREMMKLTNDANFWTRLEALKTLRQWFYRSGDNAFRREVVDLYMDHMARPEFAAIRTNLVQGMYIMLDENEAGGVSLERNIARFPQQRDRDASIAARRFVEQTVLLDPVLETLATGNKLQREALLASFDGSFFAGRFYARNPRNMIDVGNDREFSFYYQPSEMILDRTFAALFKADLSPASRAQAFQLASFFYVPQNTRDAELQGMILGGLSDPAPEVREAAMKSVRDDLAFQGENPAEPILAQVMTLLKGSDAEARLAVLTAVKRNPVILHETRVAEFAKGILENPKERALALTVIDTDLADDARATKVIAEAWNETEKDDARLALIERLFARKAMVDAAEPSKELIGLLRTIALDPATAIREKLIENLEKTEKLRRSPRMATVLHSALSDSSPGIRLRSLKLAQDQTAFWREGDTAEYMLRLLIDPDSKIRALALDTVGKFDLLGAEPRFARRVMALAADKSLGEKAKSLLVSKGFDPAKLEADGAVQGFGIPDLEFFKEKVNPYFYKEGADGHSCYDCHQNHNILRIASIPLGSDKLPEDLVIQNLNSALKVVNLGDPEQSLILRKPRSPQGQGEAPPDSPTGLVHVGGPRWASTTDPAYQEFLSWIRDAAQGNKLRLGVGVTVDSYSPDYPPALALDGDPQTIWHTEFVGATPPYPHEIVIDLGAPSATSAFQYVPRQDGSNGRVKEWELYASADGKEWGEKLASGEWPDDAAVKTVPLRAKGIRYVKLRGLSSVNNLPLMSAAEVIVLKAKDQIARGE